MTVNELTSIIDQKAPTALKEDYDNVGLLVGNGETEISGVLITLDVTEAVIDEAIQFDCNLIVAHHPLLFRSLKRITGENYIQKCVIKAIKNDLCIYAAHTNLDNVLDGVNGKIADKLGLVNRSILQPKSGNLLKLVTFVPENYKNKLLNALFEAGAGTIGNYDWCSFQSKGTGTFRANKEAHPFVGEMNKLHEEPENRIEVILPDYLISKVVAALYQSHPYEEPAFDLIPLSNRWNRVGSGIVGQLEKEMEELDFLNLLKQQFSLQTLRYTNLRNKKIKKVAVCGGSGSEFLQDAKACQADVFVSADFKYHDFFEAENEILIVDIGHYESEQFTKEIFYEIITKKNPNFAVRISDVKTNPINYL